MSNSEGKWLLEVLEARRRYGCRDQRAEKPVFTLPDGSGYR